MTQGELIEALSRQQDLVDRVSVYRNLGALKGAGVLHEVDNNSYVFCSHECEAHAHLLLFCQVCHRHEEIKDHARIETVMKALAGLRFFGETQPLFFKGVCLNCVEN